MFRHVLCVLLAFFMVSSAWAGVDTSTVARSPDPGGSHLRISLLTCGVGEEIYETFGHTAVRIIDSSKSGPLRDIVYNYGTFDGFDANFEIKFMRGKLLYYVNIDLYDAFMQEYLAAHRSVQEQVLLLNNEQKEKISSFLAQNALPANRYYKYDFFFDNCATRIRDIFPKALGPGFVFGQTFPPSSRITFRDIINKYFYRDHWERVGVNILLGSRIDRVMTNSDIMFLPDYLRDGLAGATLNGQKVSTAPELVLPGSNSAEAGTNWPLMALVAAVLLLVIGLSVRALRWLGYVMMPLFLVLTGLLGCLILVMWFWTDHQGCGNNFNILWAFPGHLAVLFLSRKARGQYAVVAIGMLFLSLLLHVVRLQAIIVEFLPIQLALLCVFAYMYRMRNVSASHNTTQPYEAAANDDALS